MIKKKTIEHLILLLKEEKILTITDIQKELSVSWNGAVELVEILELFNVVKRLDYKKKSKSFVILKETFN